MIKLHTVKKRMNSDKICGKGYMRLSDVFCSWCVCFFVYSPPCARAFSVPFNPLFSLLLKCSLKYPGAACGVHGSEEPQHCLCLANCSWSCYLMENRDMKITFSILSQAIHKHCLEIQILVLFSLSSILGSIFNWIKRNARAVPLLDMHGCLHCSDFSLKCTQYTLSS